MWLNDTMMSFHVNFKGCIFGSIHDDHSTKFKTSCIYFDPK